MKILIAAGGTGGHIFPAISLAEKIKDADPSSEIVFCMDERIDGKFLNKFNYKYFTYSAPQMPYRLSFKWIPFFIKLAFSFLKSAKCTLVL